MFGIFKRKKGMILKRKKADIETVHRVRWKNHAKNANQKLVPGPYLILVNNPKQPFHARNSF